MSMKMISRHQFLKTAAVAAASAPFIARGAAQDAFEIGLVADAQFSDIEA